MSKALVIESVRRKAEALIADNRRLRAQVETLAAQKERLGADNRSLTQQIAALEKRVAILELREGMASGSSDNRQARARINRLMREVDKCIALLGS